MDTYFLRGDCGLGPARVLALEEHPTWQRVGMCTESYMCRGQSESLGKEVKFEGGPRRRGRRGRGKQGDECKPDGLQMGK